MKYRTFGKTGWSVSEIGFGGWQLGGDFGKVDEGESIRTLHHAWDRGINFVDTAQMYGRGRSEEVIGKALREWKGSGPLYIATKVQPVAWPDASDGAPAMEGRYPAAHLREQCEGSLRRLGVEAIDLYQLHGWFPSGIQHTEWYDTLLQLQQEGKIREIGVSIRDYRPEDGIELAETGWVSSEQVVFNIFEQRPAERLLPACQKNGVGVIARVPFDEGALIGNWTLDTYDEWEEGDVRKRYFRGERYMKTFRKVEQLKQTMQQVAGDRYATLAEAALRYCLSDPAVSVVIPGMKSPVEVDLNVAVSDGEPLQADLLEAFRAYQWPRNYHTAGEE
ncbi:aldo/keto reductase [Paenibacillus mendelii]|uniref:Aldo/keto reductase n=1 Tax=Paenibacillus mendelii TaxID=206163 RepID=A0ABV6JI89_9BACL|nr:aldo/keto reductase [Paenibacillus mendelii]MCQ6558405.1 aldo/keto reductase [Paenibacillus mendelii]